MGVVPVHQVCVIVCKQESVGVRKVSPLWLLQVMQTHAVVAQV